MKLQKYKRSELPANAPSTPAYRRSEAEQSTLNLKKVAFSRLHKFIENSLKAQCEEEEKMKIQVCAQSWKNPH